MILSKTPRIEILNMDCMDFMKDVPDKYFDLCLTDFPYGCNVNYGCYNDSEQNTIALINKAMPEILRVSKRAVITSGIKLMYYYPKPDWVGCIYSSAGVGLSSHGFCCWQPLLIYGADPKLAISEGSHPDSFIYNSGNDKDSKFHPVPKPLIFWRKVLSRWTNKNDKHIFDPFNGSGTSAISAYGMGFDFTGIELDKEYFDASVKRFKEQTAQIQIQFDKPKVDVNQLSIDINQ